MPAAKNYASSIFKFTIGEICEHLQFFEVLQILERVSIFLEYFQF